MERNDFVYLEPKGSPEDFAQCRSCKMFVESHMVCSLHGMKVKVHEGMSCNEYAFGKADDTELPHVSAAFTPEESGLVDREVRCENCEFFESEDNDCFLFKLLNIDHKVNKHGCCNAQEPKDHDKKEKPLKLSRNKVTLKKGPNFT